MRQKKNDSEKPEQYSIRKAGLSDLPVILAIYAYARQKMRENGNPNQWGERKPTEETLREDIRLERLYIIEETDQITGVFCLLRGEDPTYAIIENGQWQDEKPYLTIHRIAGAPGSRRILAKAVAFGEANRGEACSLRIDTHRDNHIMQGAIRKTGFAYCGIIHIEDGSPRLAYQKQLAPKEEGTVGSPALLQKEI